MHHGCSLRALRRRRRVSCNELLVQQLSWAVCCGCWCKNGCAFRCDAVAALQRDTSLLTYARAGGARGTMQSAALSTGCRHRFHRSKGRDPSRDDVSRHIQASRRRQAIEQRLPSHQTQRRAASRNCLSLCLRRGRSRAGPGERTTHSTHSALPHHRVRNAGQGQPHQPQ